MTRLIAALFVIATVAGCAETPSLATKNVTAPPAETMAVGMENPFAGLMPQ